MGIPAHFRGYAYLRDAVIMSVREVELLGNITKNLYPRIAEKYRSTASGVESAIRHTIEIGWQRGNPEFMGRFFGYSAESGHGRFPTTASFIAKVADRLRLGVPFGLKPGMPASPAPAGAGFLMRKAGPPPARAFLPDGSMLSRIQVDCPMGRTLYFGPNLKKRSHRK